MPLLASDVMSASRVYLNDIGAALYTNTILLEPLKLANERLEKLLILCGASIQRQATSPAITVNALATSLTLPSDFLLPIELFERRVGESDSDWVPMYQKDWEPKVVQTESLTWWAFRNNEVKFIGATVAKEVLLRYERQLAVISGANSPEDNIIVKDYLAAKTAELAARFIGMNSTHADEIAAREVAEAQDSIERIYVLQNQGTPVRRMPFNTMKSGTLRR